MSYRALNWAWEAELPFSQKFVLIALADMADEKDSCFPGQERLASMTGMSISTVRRAVKSLEDAGVIVRHARGIAGGGRTSDRYVLMTNRPICTVRANRSESTSKPVTLTAETGHGDRGTTREPLEEPPALLSPDESDDHGTLIPDEWRPNQRHIDKAASLRLDVKNEYQRFRAHAERTHRRMKSWNTGFTNWLRKSAEMNQQRGGGPVRQTFAQQRQSNSVALVAGLMEREQHEEVGSSPRARVLELGRGE